MTKEPRDFNVGQELEFKNIFGKHLESYQYPQAHLNVTFSANGHPPGNVCLPHSLALKIRSSCRLEGTQNRHKDKCEEIPTEQLALCTGQSL